jgi:hypothetical protein
VTQQIDGQGLVGALPARIREQLAEGQAAREVALASGAVVETVVTRRADCPWPDRACWHCEGHGYVVERTRREPEPHIERTDCRPCRDRQRARRLLERSGLHALCGATSCPVLASDLEAECERHTRWQRGCELRAEVLHRECALREAGQRGDVLGHGNDDPGIPLGARVDALGRESCEQRVAFAATTIHAQHERRPRVACVEDRRPVVRPVGAHARDPRPAAWRARPPRRPRNPHRGTGASSR